VQTLAYDGFKGDVPAYLVKPEHGEAKDAIVYLHSAVTNKDLFLEEAQTMAQHGFVSLLIDAPFLRPGFEKIRSGRKTPGKEFAYVQHVLGDIKRGFDLLEQNFPIERFFYVGKNLGATVLGSLSAVEPRLFAAVFVAGIPRLSYFWEQSEHPVAGNFRASMDPQEFHVFVEGTRDLDFVSSVSCGFTKNWLFQFGKQDDWIPESEIELLKKPLHGYLNIRWYDDDHDMNSPAVAQDRVEWLIQSKK
jgi:dienelactone hydrolase